jgi:hypothetical protein
MDEARANRAGVGGEPAWGADISLSVPIITYFIALHNKARSMPDLAVKRQSGGLRSTE